MKSKGCGCGGVLLLAAVGLGVYALLSSQNINTSPTASAEPKSKTNEQTRSIFKPPLKKVPTNRSERVQAVFEWDGSVFSFVRTVKKQMHDPSSFEHVETRYIDPGTGATFTVNMQYRGKNVLGAKVLNRATGVIDLDGNCISWMPFEP